MSIYEASKSQVVLFQRKTESQKLADHIYKRILYWQSVHKIWQEQERKEYEQKR